MCGEDRDLHSEELNGTCSTDEQALACFEELQALKERYAYLAADVENMKRRADQERVNAVRREQIHIMRAILPVMDDLERALAQITTQGADAADVREGIVLVQRNFAKILEKYGVVAMTDIKQFDPHLHEAVMQVHKEGAASGTVVEVLQKGYMLRGELLRPAQVSVVA